MIAVINGRLRSREPQVVVDVGAVGFAVHVSARTAAELPALGAELSLFTYLHVREDQLSLYGFASERERALFLLFLGVNGVGPRLALTLLSSAPLEELEAALRDGDEAYLVRLPGVGRKTAARLLVELQGKLAAAPAAARVQGGALFEEAVLALASLGLNQRAARDAVEKVARAGGAGQLRVEDIVKAALQAASR
jgi:Holliday junction DNA helicase RuvA